MTQMFETLKDDLRRTEQSCVEMFLIRFLGHSDDGTLCLYILYPLKACTTVQPSKCRDSHETIAIIKQWIQNRVSVSVSVGDSVSDGLSACQCPWSERRQTPKILICT